MEVLKYTEDKLARLKAEWAEEKAEIEARVATVAVQARV